MVKNFLNRLWAVIKYIPSATWKMVFTMHLVLTIPIASSILKENNFSPFKTFMWVAIWYALIVWPIIIIVYWRMHHGKG